MKWIKAEDRLPEINQPVWAYVNGYSSPTLMVRNEFQEDGKKVWVWAIGSDVPWVDMDGKWQVEPVWDSNYIVTHWHPLPELLNL